MAIYAGKLRIRGVDMDEIVPFGIDLFKCVTAALRERGKARDVCEARRFGRSTKGCSPG